MRSLNGKTTGSTLTASEWNDMPTELQNMITDTGQSLSAGDLDQVGKAVSNYIANADYYTVGGTPDVITLAQVGTKQPVTAYVDGMKIRFRPTGANTGAVTVNVSSLGARDLRNINDVALVANELIVGYEYTCVFDNGTNRFTIQEITDLKGAGALVAKGMSNGAGTADAITADFTPNITLTDKVTVLVRSQGNITTTTPTFSPDGLAAKTIVKANNEALILNNIKGSDQELLLQYNASNDNWVLLNPRFEDSPYVAVEIASGSQVVSTATTGSVIIDSDAGGLSVGYIISAWDFTLAGFICEIGNDTGVSMSVWLETFETGTGEERITLRMKNDSGANRTFTYRIIRFTKV